MGFLHALLPGRAALALDLMEELRSVLADRLVLTLINRRQVSAKDFTKRSGGAGQMEDAGRKEVIVAYQKRKKEEITNTVLAQKVQVGWVTRVQARLRVRVLEAVPRVSAGFRVAGVDVGLFRDNLNKWSAVAE
mgnify:CR=1 FL=1